MKPLLSGGGPQRNQGGGPGCFLGGRNKINVINKIVYASDELGYINRKLESIVKDYKLMYKNSNKSK